MANKEAAKEIAAANIAAILVALGKTTADEITKAFEVYHRCLDELNKPQQRDTEWSKEDDAAIDRSNNEGGRTDVWPQN